MENQKQQPRYKYLWISVSLLSLALLYIFQQLDYLHFIRQILGNESLANPNIAFIFNKTLRLIMNDLLCFLLIFALFGERKYLRVAFFVFCFEFFLLLPVYFVVKLTMEGSSEISSPLLSQIHRLIVNPMLMLMLIVAFYYQRSRRT